MSPSQLIYLLFTPFISQSVVSNESPVNLSGEGASNQTYSHQHNKVESIVKVSDGGGTPKQEPTSEEPETMLNQLGSTQIPLTKNFPTPSYEWINYRGSEIPFTYNETKFEESDKFEFLITNRGLKCTIKAEQETDSSEWELFPQVAKKPLHRCPDSSLVYWLHTFGYIRGVEAMELFEGSCLDSPPCAAECIDSAIPAIDELIKKQAEETERLTIDYLQVKLDAFTAETLKWKNDYINALKNRFESSNLSNLNFDWETLIDTNPVPSSQRSITDSREEGDDAEETEDEELVSHDHDSENETLSLDDSHRIPAVYRLIDKLIRERTNSSKLRELWITLLKQMVVEAKQKAQQHLQIPHRRTTRSPQEGDVDELVKQSLVEYLHESLTPSLINSLKSIKGEASQSSDGNPLDDDDMNPKKYQIVPPLSECKEHRFCTGSDHFGAKVDKDQYKQDPSEGDDTDAIYNDFGWWEIKDAVSNFYSNIENLPGDGELGSLIGDKKSFWFSDSKLILNSFKQIDARNEISPITAQKIIIKMLIDQLYEIRAIQVKISYDRYNQILINIVMLIISTICLTALLGSVVMVVQKFCKMRKDSKKIQQRDDLLAELRNGNFAANLDPIYRPVVSSAPRLEHILPIKPKKHRSSSHDRKGQLVSSVMTR